MATQSAQFSLNRKDLESLGRGLLITVIGAGLTYLANNLGKLEFGTATVFVVPILALLVNTAKKYIGE